MEDSENSNSKCRLCLNVSDYVENLFTTNSKYLHIIEEFTGLKIIKKPEFPSVICNVCINTIQLLLEFKNKCKKSQDILEGNYECTKKNELFNIEQVFINAKLIDNYKTEELNSTESFICYNLSTSNENNTENAEEKQNLIQNFVSNNNEPRRSKRIAVESKTKMKTEDLVKNEISNLTKNIVSNNEQKEFKEIKVKSQTKMKKNNSKCSKEITKKKSSTKTKISENGINCDSNQVKKKSKNNKNKVNAKKKYKSESIACHMCGKVILKTSIKGHMNIHLGLFPYHCKEINCDKKFPSSQALGRHMIAHSSNRPYECNICNNRFKIKSRLDLHRTYHFEPQLPCKLCGKLLRNPKALKEHLFAHTEERPFPCDKCSKSFKNQWTLKVHSRIHSQERLFSCTQCNMSFKYKSVLKGHIEKRHPEIILDCRKPLKSYPINNIEQ